MIPNVAGSSPSSPPSWTTVSAASASTPPPAASPGRSPPSGTVPDDPAARLAWQQKAAAIGAYRELSGHDHPDDPIGPEPAANSPDLRAAWQSARAALTPDDVRHSRESWLPGLAETSRRIEELAARRHELTVRMSRTPEPDRHRRGHPAHPPSRLLPLTAGLRYSSRPSPRSRCRPGSWNG